MRDTFVKTLISLAKEDSNIELITGDLGFGVLKPFYEALPNQFTNAGIAEQNMTALAAGMAIEGKTVIIYSIGNFPTFRCLEQIRNDCAYNKANVKIVCVGGGFVYGALGMSHQATEDIAIMRALPNVTVFVPTDAVETEAITKAMIKQPGTCYLRLSRGGEKKAHEKLDDFEIGKAIQMQEGKRVAIFSSGTIYEEVQIACEILKKEGLVPTVYTFPTVKPIDCQVILGCADNYELIVTCEEHNIVGGFGSAVAEVVAEQGARAKLLRIGMNDTYCEQVGNQKYLRDIYGMSGEKIATRILENLK